MTDILKKSIVCTGFCCSVLFFATGCDMEMQAPDTLEGILNIPSPEQETVVTETAGSVPEKEEDTTEYQSIFFRPESETAMPETQVISSESVSIPATETEPVTDTSGWEQAYRAFLEQAGYEIQFPEDSNTQEVKFLLLYLNEDDIPELFIQTTGEVYFYTYQNQQVVYADCIPVSHYTYDFHYRPYHNCICTLQGSVMADGTYLNVWQYETSASEKSGLALVTEYCFPTREYSYEVYSEKGMHIDLEKAPMLDIHMDREINLGSSWFTVPDILDANANVCRYDITEENLDAVFGIKDKQEEMFNAFG